MSVNFEELGKRYDGFRHPFLTVSIDGAEDTSPDVFIRGVELTLTCGYEAGACTFELTGKGNGFLDNKLTLDPAVQKYLKLGAKLEVATGYTDGEHCQSVFTGCVTAVTLTMEGARVFHVIEAMDCKALMMNNLCSEIKEGLKKDSEAVVNVLKAYGSAAPEPEVGETVERSGPIGRYAQSDYDFLVELARRNNFLFFVDRGKVRFIPYSAVKEVGVVLTPGSHLFRLERTVSLTGQVKTVTVRGAGQPDPETPVAATAAGADPVGGGGKTAAEVCSLVGDTAAVTLIDGSVGTEAEAKAGAEAAWQRAGVGFVAGSFETVGVPELLPGTLVTLADFDGGVNGDYLITEAVHKLDVGNYRTVCQFRRSRD